MHGSTLCLLSVVFVFFFVFLSIVAIESKCSECNCAHFSNMFAYRILFCV